MEREKRRKRISGITTVETYKYYVKAYEKSPVSKTLYTAILRDFFGLLFERVLFKNFEFILPNNAGVLSIAQRKPVVEVDADMNITKNTGAINWPATLEFWNNNPDKKEEKETIRYSNPHTFNRIMRFVWFRGRSKIPGVRVYGLQMARSVKRKFAKIIKSGEYVIQY